VPSLAAKASIISLRYPTVAAVADDAPQAHTPGLGELDDTFGRYCWPHTWPSSRRRPRCRSPWPCLPGWAWQKPRRPRHLRRHRRAYNPEFAIGIGPQLLQQVDGSEDAPAGAADARFRAAGFHNTHSRKSGTAESSQSTSSPSSRRVSRTASFGPGRQ